MTLQRMDNVGIVVDDLEGPWVDQVVGLNNVRAGIVRGPEGILVALAEKL